MGQETRNAAGLGQAEAGRGLGRGPCELRGLRGRRGWRTEVATQRWSRQGPTRKDGARDSTAMEIQPAVGGRGFKLRWTELLGQRSDSAGVASGQTPKKPEEQAGARRKSTKRPRVREDQWVTGARVRSWARSQCRRNGPWRGHKMFLDRMERLSLRRE